MQNNSQSKADATSISADFSIYISIATYSTIFNQNLYFIDEYDGLLKIYDTDQKRFLDEYVDLNEYGEIVDATYLDGYFFLYTSQNQLIIINLTDFNITTLENESLNQNYFKISVNKIYDNETELFAISLTPNEITETITPLVFLINSTTLELNNICNITFTPNDFTDIKSDLIKFFVLESQIVDGEINLIFFYGSNVAFSTLSLNSLKNNEIISAVTLISAQLDNTNPTVHINNINMLNISNTSYFLITYSENVEDAYSKVYSYRISNSIETSFTYLSQIESSNNNYLLTSNDYAIYPNDNQSITYTQFIIDSNTENILNYSSVITNPNVMPNYFTEENFVYMQTNTTTNLLSSPWDFDAVIEIEPDVDVINIGEGMIEGEISPIQDFVYCLYTFNGVNYKGYIRTENLTPKTIIQPESYAYQVFKVVPNSNLYSLPTKVIGDQITNNLTSSVIMQIRENSRVEVVDVICEYTALDSTMLKVQVNGNQIGYIEVNNIIHPSDEANFVITNSSIMNDNTNVYIDSNSSSDIIYTLNKGYRIRINGVRDTKTGFTNITFNDEYGNEFTGYIVTDVISTDSWTTLQIVGCILIAINIGLLILILKFKKEKIGGRGQKYQASEVSNYTKSETLTTEKSDTKKEDEN